MEKEELKALLKEKQGWLRTKDFFEGCSVKSCVDRESHEIRLYVNRELQPAELKQICEELRTSLTIEFGDRMIAIEGKALPSDENAERY